jgi:3',5'-cyclic AMP phosphodiesterase CpdA
MTDFHVQPEGIAPSETARALRHAQDQADPPEIIFNTGDSIMDALATSAARAEEQWAVFSRIMSDECHLPIVHVIGNHDIWGWGLSDSTLKPDDSAHGKEMALQHLGLSSRYYSFDRAGWHFVVLDSNHPPNAVSSQPYIGQLDDEQFGWFVQDVEAVSSTTPICVLSHIPLLAACEYFDGLNEESGNWVIPAAWVHLDARRFRQLFLHHPNIRLCLSGHTHQHEVLDYLGVRYLTNGAVSGNWWEGVYMDFPPAYVMVNLYEDGSADSTFVPY